MVLSVPLEALFPELLSLSHDLMGLVNSHWSDRGWNVRFSGYILAEIQQQWEELFLLLSKHLLLIEDSRNRPLWKWDSRRTFSLKNAYFRLNDGGLRCPFAKVVWQIKVPLKIRTFIWLVVKDTTLTWDNLMKRNWKGPKCLLFVWIVGNPLITCLQPVRIQFRYGGIGHIVWPFVYHNCLSNWSTCGYLGDLIHLTKMRGAFGT